MAKRIGDPWLNLVACGTVDASAPAKGVFSSQFDASGEKKKKYCVWPKGQRPFDDGRLLHPKYGVPTSFPTAFRPHERPLQAS
jgi:hypothetical protein